MKQKRDESLPFEYKTNSRNDHPLNTCKDIASNIERFLSAKDVAHLMRTMKSNYLFYLPNLMKFKALNYVVEGNVISLIELITEDISLLFAKGQIKAPRKQIYYNVSAYQLMIFLCDDDMMAQIMPLIPEHFNIICQQQYAEIDCGGADLIKVNRDPLDIIVEKGFIGLLQYQATYTLLSREQQDVNLPLLENPNGIICYQDANNEKHFYYADKKKETIKALDKFSVPKESEFEFERFKTSFDIMENNSGRRSSEQEHKLIEKILDCSLARKGILYKDNDILYRDTRTPFKIINTYRKCIRFFNEEYNGDLCKAFQYLCDGVGQAQGEELWLLQRLCEDNRPFYPLPQTFDNFKRVYTIENYHSNGKKEPVFQNGIIKISDFVIHKASRRALGLCPGDTSWSHLWCKRGMAVDFVVLCNLIENAKKNVAEYQLVEHQDEVLAFIY